VDIAAAFTAYINSTPHVLEILNGKETARLTNINTLAVYNEDGIIQTLRPHGTLYSPGSNSSPPEPIKKQVMADDHERFLFPAGHINEGESQTRFTNYQLFLDRAAQNPAYVNANTTPAVAADGMSPAVPAFAALAYDAADTGLMHYVSYFDLTRAPRGTSITRSVTDMIDHGAVREGIPVREQSALQTVAVYDFISYSPEMFEPGSTRDSWMDTLAEWGLFQEQKEFMSCCPPEPRWTGATFRSPHTTCTRLQGTPTPPISSLRRRQTM
jgi:hypothetical protein